MTTMSTEILMATYNGATHLGELLASLDAQTDQDWTLVVRDDGSTDGTPAVLDRWGEARPGRLRVLRDGDGRLGARGSFGALLEASEADYFLLCDQDDVWLPDKISRLKARIRTAERESSATVPIIVFTDLIVTDAALNPIAQSFWRYQRLAWPAADAPWKIIALQNVVAGCGAIGNAALRQAAVPMPPEAIMHDWWLALIAASMGRLIEDPVPSVLYRQHGGNDTGAKPWTVARQIERLLRSPVVEVRRACSSIERSQAQARCFAARYGGQLEAVVLGFLLEYGALSDQGTLTRKTFPLRHRLWFGDAIRNIGLVVVI